MGTEKTIRLSLLARKKRLPVLPGQPAGTAYGIVWDACPIPEGGLCYIVRFVERLRVSIVGLVANNGRAYRASGPVEGAAKPEDVELILVRGAEERVGEVYARDAQGQLKRVSEFRGSLEGTMREVSGEQTWNTEHSLMYREFMATMYLRYCVFPARDVALDGSPAGADESLERIDPPVQIFDTVHALNLPDAISAIIYRISQKDRPSGIERYVKRLLARIDLPRLRSVAVAGGVHLARIEKMNGFYINFDRDVLDAQDTMFLFSVESVLNRLSHVLDEIGAGMGPIMSSPSEEGCATIDRQGLEAVSANVERLLSAADRSPRASWKTPGTVPCVSGGEWDVRMHFAELCEGLNLLVRLEYRFDYRAEDGLMAIRFTGMPGAVMPSELYDSASRTWIELSEDTRERMGEEFTCRVALVLAAASFSASPLVCRCLVEATSPVDGVHRAFDIERTRFLVDLAPLAHELVGVALTNGRACAALKPCASTEGYHRIVSPDSLRAPGEDERTLPDNLRGLLLADTARELEVTEDPQDGYRKRFTELQRAVITDPARAESGLSDLIGEIQAGCVEAELLSSHPVRTQFCENHLGRIILPLFIDDPQVRIHRPPDTLFFAQYELCTMYLNSGSYDSALREARQLLDVATTSMQAHFALINVLARLRMFDEVIEVAKHGLRAAYDRDSIAYLFYRLAFACWNEGQRMVALACYRLVPPGERVSAVAAEEASELMRRLGMTERLSAEQAAGIVQAEGIPIPPTEELLNQVADSAVLLLDNGFFYLAARCAYGMWRMYGSDELGSLSKSLLA